jgi:prepilin-type N-terminal cleavage/methylation domain-containing protein
MTQRIKSILLSPFSSNKEMGFTLVEIIIAIVVIGVTVPAIIIPFSGLENTKNPEYVIQASFVAQKKMEELSNQFRDTITTPCPEVTPAVSTDGAYSLSCESAQVTAADPDTTAVSTFARKVTLKVSRTDGAIAEMEFSSLFLRDS